jgi:hypothetical protein
MLLKVNIIKIYGGNTMKNVAEVAEKLEVLRAKLNEEINNSDGSKEAKERILKISKEVDVLIVEYQKMLNKE